MITIIDSAIYNFLLKFFNMPVLHFLRIITYLGSAQVLISICVMCYILIKNRKIGTLLSVNLILVFLLNRLIKLIVARPRPNVLRLEYETGYSFPSGHAMVSCAFYGLIIVLINKSKMKDLHKKIFIMLLSILILFIGISRVFLGVHYATDVICGFIFALLYLFIFCKYTINRKVNKMNYKNKKETKGKADGSNI